MIDDQHTHGQISSTDVATGSTSVSEVRLHDGALYWLERRPQEGGRTTILRHQAGSTDELLPITSNCRSRVHEYGGGAFTPADSGLYFIEDSGQQIHRLDADGAVHRLTDESDSRYTDIRVDDDNGFIIAVEETHEIESVTNRLVRFALDGSSRSIIHEGHDFYASPTLDVSGMRLSWICWDQPDMPWDSTRLYTCDTDYPETARCIAGGEGVSIFQPRWSGDYLYFVSDENGWWNLYRVEGGTSSVVYQDEAEYGSPQWVFGQSTYCADGDGIIAARNHEGKQSLWRIDPESRTSQLIDHTYTVYESLSCHDGMIACIAASDTVSPQVCVSVEGALEPVQNQKQSIPVGQISRPETRTITTRFADTIYASYYPPCTDVWDGSAPLIVIGHGGPTGQSFPVLDLKKQYWTQRGFAILDVDYSGSTGYGREYRRRLEGEWGCRDVTDLCDAALAMVDAGLARSDRLIIKGSSAGGYTVLAALTMEDTFSVGVSYYGISDLTALADDTHKFEARYLDKLIGPYPEMAQTYEERSPINHVDALNCPVLFLQGEEDRVVPMEQAQRMYDALREKGIRTKLRLYPGEQHGFRQAETIVDALDQEYQFYIEVFGDPASG